MPRYAHTIPEDPPRLRIDAYAVGVFPALASRAAARKAIKAGRLLCDGAACNSAWFVRSGAVLSLDVPDAPRAPVLEMALDVAYADDHLAVIRKPAGIHVRGNYHRTIARALRYNLPLSPLPDALPDPDPVHRLDFRTSGLLLVARAAGARQALGQMLEQRRVRKRYRALLLGRLEGEGEVDLPVEGRPALSRYRAAEHTRSLRTGWLTTADLWPVTGRMHQLRRHVTSLGHPVLGDDLYHDGDVFRGCGLFLCAVELSLPHPATGEPLRVEIPEPAKFAAHRAREARRWGRWRAGEE